MRLSPNPTDSRALVSLDPPRASHVRVTVLDLQGRGVAVLADEQRPAGPFEVMTSGGAPGSTFKAGVYFVRAEITGLAAPIVHRLAVVH